jgi:hypothetical protein
MVIVPLLRHHTQTIKWAVSLTRTELCAYGLL